MYKKKLIETSIPLDDINDASAGEKNIRKGYPATLHLWWARRPLAAARCVIFASMVDDPSEHPELFPTEEEQNEERERLHGIIRRLADWNNINDNGLYAEAYSEMAKYAPDGNLPEFLDPFAGGGALPLEAQRLGLVSHAADLNPIPVTLNRAMIDIPARFCERQPVHPDLLTRESTWQRATGLAEDVEYYSSVMRNMAYERLKNHYCDVKLPSEYGGGTAPAIAWLWARTVDCPNPACGGRVPLIRSYDLSKRRGKERHVDVICDGKEIHFEVSSGKADKEGTVRRTIAVCPHCNQPFSLDYVKQESISGRMGAQLMAVVAEGTRGRLYISPDEEQEAAANVATPRNYPTGRLAPKFTGGSCVPYGLDEFHKLFSNRQLTMLLTFSDLVGEIRPLVENDAIAAGMVDDGLTLAQGGCGAKAYAEAISVYLAFMVDKLADSCSTICTWNSNPSSEAVRNMFARQAIPMTWDYAESNPFSSAAGSFNNCSQRVVDVLKALPAKPQCDSVQRDATKATGLSNVLISTDPPYYDNIAYSDLSDYFYIWMRRSLRNVFPQLYSTMLTPKEDELIATSYRFDGDTDAANRFFENGMKQAFTQLASAASEAYPMTIYYAYKQTQDTEEGRTSSGWETMLQALMDSGLQITGTWPIRTERKGRTVGNGTNALASSIVLVCRKRDVNAPDATRPEFQRELRRSLRRGVGDLQQGSIAPVDMAQASIGPGMAAFSKYSRVVESDGTPMSVHTALGIINEQLDALMGESGAELDNETRFCITWYEQFGFEKGDFGTAETLRNARGADFAGLQHAGVLVNDGGKTWLVSPTDVANPEQARLSPSSWSDLMACIAALEDKGIDGAARVLASFGEDYERGERAKGLAYILFQAAERGGRANDATLFNGIVTSWADIAERAEAIRRTEPVQQQLDFNL